VLHRDGVEGECFTRLQAPFQGAANTLEQLAALSQPGTEARFSFSYPGIGVLTMPTASRLRSVSGQTTPPSPPDLTAGAAGDLRHDRTADLSSADIESTCPDAQPLWAWAEDPTHEDDWDGYYEKLARVIQQARALAFAHHALVSYCRQTMDMPEEQAHSEALSDLGIRTCDEALRLAVGLRQASVCWKDRALSHLIPDEEQLSPAQACTARIKAEAFYREREQGKPSETGKTKPNGQGKG
jgi:hypothetical protein